jgi:hypothetical protein
MGEAVQGLRGGSEELMLNPIRAHDARVFQRLLSEPIPDGPRIEFGVNAGKGLKLIAQHTGETVGVDSFEGMAAPTARDFAPGAKETQWPKGKMSRPMFVAAQAVPGAKLIKGFVPKVLSKVPNGPYAFAHLDMDQFDPTLFALEWLFDGRLLPGALVAAHDWYEGRGYLAGGACNKFAEKVPITGTESRYAWWRV